jgi:lysyl-tRNA synthetase class 2
MPTASASAEQRRLRELAPALRLRSRVLQSIRTFFVARDFIEVETPVRVRTPALESHIDAEPSGAGWLRTSPELHMKRLLAGGYARIFQMGPCFRAGERGARHHPEYTMLEWYRADAGYLDILADTKALVAHVAQAVLGRTALIYRGAAVELMPVWDFVTVADAFVQHAGWNPVTHFDPERFDLDMVQRVEPGLPVDRPVVLADYPVAAAALARRKPGDERVAERWELYIAGMELANAYGELTDAAEQRRRFSAWAEERRGRGQVVYDLDEPFLAALDAGLPPCAGVALGVDRLVMLLADAASLDDILPFRDEFP